MSHQTPAGTVPSQPLRTKYDAAPSVTVTVTSMNSPEVTSCCTRTVWMPTAYGSKRFGIVALMLPLDGVYDIGSPTTAFPCWSTMAAEMVRVSSAVMVAVSGVTNNSVGAPGVTVM